MSKRSEISPPPSKRRRTADAGSKNEPSATAPTIPTRPITALSESELRIFTWNVNGISPFLQSSITSFFQPSSVSLSSSPSSSMKEKIPGKQRSPNNLREILRRWCWPQIVCLQEVKIAPGDRKTQDMLRRAVRAPSGPSEPGYEAFFSLPRDKFNARGFGGKVYGVCCLVRTDVFEQQKSNDESVSVKPVEWDLEGRVLSIRLPRSKLAVVNIYAVNGTDNPYRSPNTGEISGTRHDHKRKTHLSLRDLVARHERDGWSVVVAGDLNIAQDVSDGFPGIRLAPAHVANRHDFAEKFTKPKHENGLGMVDSFRHLHGSERKYTYRSPGIPWGASCDRVDLILLTSDLLMSPSCLKESDILDEELERGPSDHLPSYVTLDLKERYVRLSTDDNDGTRSTTNIVDT